MKLNTESIKKHTELKHRTTLTSSQGYKPSPTMGHSTAKMML